MIQETQISILVVTHNHSEFIDKLLESLIRFDIKNVFFCDAKSTDDTAQKLLNSQFKANVLVKNILEGFSKNNNDLIRHFKLNSKYYLLLNPDTFFDTNFIEVLYSKISLDDRIGIVAPLLKYPDGRFQVTWKKFPNAITVIKKRLRALKAIDEKPMGGPEIDWCLGACMLISSQLLKSNRCLLDERFRLYCEDIDICFEAKSRGLKVLGIKEAYIYHHLNESSTKKVFGKYNIWNIKSIIKFILKWNVKYFKEIS